MKLAKKTGLSQGKSPRSSTPCSPRIRARGSSRSRSTPARKVTIPVSGPSPPRGRGARQGRQPATGWRRSRSRLRTTFTSSPGKAAARARSRVATEPRSCGSPPYGGGRPSAPPAKEYSGRAACSAVACLALARLRIRPVPVPEQRPFGRASGRRRRRARRRHGRTRLRVPDPSPGRAGGGSPYNDPMRSLAVDLGGKRFGLDRGRRRDRVARRLTSSRTAASRPPPRPSPRRRVASLPAVVIGLRPRATAARLRPAVAATRSPPPSPSSGSRSACSPST